VKQSTSELEKKGVKAFNYRHLGSFAYVGDNKAVLQLPIIGEL
jgi:NADH dehydrogenase FAD-containing subunit